MTDTLQTLIDKIQTYYLNCLIVYLEKDAIEPEHAKEITSEFLNLGSYNSVDELKQKIYAFTQLHGEFYGLYIELLKMIEEQKTLQVISKMKQLFHHNEPHN